MPPTKGYTALLAPTSVAAGTPQNSAAVAIGYGLSIIVVITNGATGPTLGCDAVLQVSDVAGTTWYEADRRTAPIAGSAIYPTRFDLGVGGAGGDWYQARVQFTGNTGQAVTARADAHSTTALV